MKIFISIIFLVFTCLLTINLITEDYLFAGLSLFFMFVNLYLISDIQNLEEMERKINYLSEQRIKNLHELIEEKDKKILELTKKLQTARKNP